MPITIRSIGKQIMSRQGLGLDRSTLADWVGRAAYELRPVFDAPVADLKRSSKLFMDETRAPVASSVRSALQDRHVPDHRHSGTRHRIDHPPGNRNHDTCRAQNLQVLTRRPLLDATNTDLLAEIEMQPIMNLDFIADVGRMNGR